MNEGDFRPIVPGLGLAGENARLKQQLADQTANAGIICENCDSDEPLQAGMCLPCWNMLVREKMTLEAKLAVATGLLKRALQPPYLAGPINDPTAAEIAVFLADPSQAAVQYRAALAVVSDIRELMKTLANPKVWEGETSVRVSIISVARHISNRLELLGEEKP